MAVAEQIRFGYFRYTANDGSFWSVRADQDWGALAASGLGAFNQADPLWPHTRRYQTRKCILVDPTTGLKTTRTTGTIAATANTSGTVIVSVVRGSAGTVSYQSSGMIGEKRPHTKPLIPVADTTTT
jgi:hypothetical protein